MTAVGSTDVEVQLDVDEGAALLDAVKAPFAAELLKIVNASECYSQSPRHREKPRKNSPLTHSAF